MLALDVIFGSKILPDLMGIIAGHLYYFLTVLHPLAGGKNILKTPKWVYPFIFGSKRFTNMMQYRRRLLSWECYNLELSLLPAYGIFMLCFRGFP